MALEKVTRETKRSYFRHPGKKSPRHNSAVDFWGRLFYFFTTAENTTMKSFLLSFLFSTFTMLSVAQTNNTAPGQPRTNKEDRGATPYGLPVQKSYVAPDAVERAKKKYGRALYSIEKSTAANCEQSYLVGLIQNGKLTMEWMCDDPKLAIRKAKYAVEEFFL